MFGTIGCIAQQLASLLMLTMDPAVMAASSRPLVHIVNGRCRTLWQVDSLRVVAVSTRARRCENSNARSRGGNN
jgi:hypothetical protein